MASHKSLLLLTLTALLLRPATCQASPLAMDIGREIILYQDSIYRSKWPFVETMVGTPGQSLKMLLSINVGDIVVLTADQTNERCSGAEYADFLCQWGLYDTSASSTFTLQGQNTTDEYNTYGNSTTGSDVFKIGDRTFQDLTMVFRPQDWPIFGVGGYTSQEHVTPTYSNVPIQLNSDGDTNIIGFSLYFQRVNATTPGRLLFGGVETNKFTGTLETLQTPFSSETLTYGNITAQLANMSISTSTSRTAINSFTDTQVILSAQVAGLFLPTAALQEVLVQLGLSQAYVLTDGEFDNDLEGPLLPYDSAPNDTSINLQFGSVQISIPFWDIFLPYNSTHGFLSLTEPAEGTQPVIGTGFFSNAYSVFDFTHNQISIAPLRHEALNDDNIEAINSTGVAGLQGYTSTGSNSNNPTSSANSSGSGGLSTGAKAGIGVGAALGALLVIGLIVFFILRSRRRRSHGQAQQANTYNDTTNNNHPTNAPYPTNTYPTGTYPTAAPNDEMNRQSLAPSSNWQNYHGGAGGEKTELAAASENSRVVSGGHSTIPVSPMSDSHTFSSSGDGRQEMSESMSATTFLGSNSDRNDGVKRKPVQVSELP